MTVCVTSSVPDPNVTRGWSNCCLRGARLLWQYDESVRGDRLRPPTALRPCSVAARVFPSGRGSLAELGGEAPSIFLRDLSYAGELSRAIGINSPWRTPNARAPDSHIAPAAFTAA